MSLEWMNTKATLEEELTLETHVRAIGETEDIPGLRNLCIALARQNFHQTKLLSQAVSRIAELDAAEIWHGN